MNEIDDPVERLFQAAAEIECPDKRKSFLDDACLGDPNLRNELEELLQHDEQADDFLDGPAVAPLKVVNDNSICESPGTVMGHYKLMEQIGEGAFGLVFVAQQQEPVRRQVALKIIKPGMDTKEVIARFEVERQALALMAHPNICQVFDAGATDSGRPYFVMELVKGVPITEYCDRREIPLRQRLELFISVCRAIHHAHSKGVIHRDLKPSNILVSPHDGIPVVKVIDFGIAKALGQQLSEATVYTQYSQMIGTPLYMSPEQAEINALDVDTRSDVYSLGVLLYELLAGSTPFDRERFSTSSYDEIRRLIREEDPPKPSTRLSSVSANLPTISTQRKMEPASLMASLKGELDWLVMKCLEKDRSRRYVSANALADDVERYLGDELVLARPPSSLYRIQKFIHRNRLLAVSGTGIFLALAVGLTLATFGLHSAQQRLAEVTEEQENNRIMLRLFRDMYGIPWGMETYAHRQTMRASVDDLSDGLDERLRGHPKVAIEIHTIFARTFRNTGDLEKARNHLNKALESAREVYGPGHEKVADILANLAYEIKFRNNTIPLATTRKHAEQAIGIYEELGIETGGTAMAQLCKASAIAVDPALQNVADECLRTALRITEDLSPEEYQHVFALSDLSWHLAKTSNGPDDLRLHEAMDLIRKSVDMCRQLPNQRILLAMVLQNQGMCFKIRNDVGKAIESYQEAWDIYQVDNLQNEPRGHRIALKLAEIYFVEGEHQKAHDFLANLEGICRDHETLESLAECQTLRGWGYLIRDDYGPAELYLRDAVGIAEKLPNVGSAMAFSNFHLARLLIAVGRNKDAQVHVQNVLDLTSQLVKEDTADEEIILFGHAWSLVHREESTDTDLQQAIKYANRGLTQSSARQQSWQEPHFHLVIALAEHKLGRESAIASLKKGLAKCGPFPSLRASHLTVPASRRELELALARVYEHESIDKAEKVYIDAVAQRRIDFPPDQFPNGHVQIALAELRLGTFLREHGKSLRADELIKSANEQLRELGHETTRPTELGE